MKTNMSPYNGTFDVKKENFIFCDVTMREGEQSPGVVFSLDEKKEMLYRLSDIGIDQIQFYPGRTKESQNVVKKLIHTPISANIQLTALGFEDCWKDNIKRSIDYGTQVLHSSFYTTPYICDVWNADTPKVIQDRIAEVVIYAKSQSNVPMEISFIDATRAEESYLLELTETAFSAGADRVRLADTIGVASPEAMSHLVSKCAEVSKKYNGIIGVHCHNDFGMALANTIASIKAGARLIDVAVNGMGDRAGNTSLAELVVGLKAFYDVDTKINMKALGDLSRYVAKVSGRPIADNAPLIGNHVFVDCDDTHIQAHKLSPLSFRGIMPEDIGMEYRILYGKLTGPNAIRMTAEKYGKKIDEKYFPYIRDALYKMAEEAPKGKVLTEEDFWRVTEKIMN